MIMFASKMLSGPLKQVAKRALESEKTDEKKLQGHLSAKLSQWVMNVAVNKDDSAGGSMNLGGMMGGGGGMNLADLFGGGGSGDGATAEDKKWAALVSRADYVDDVRKDDPDYMKDGVPKEGAFDPKKAREESKQKQKAEAQKKKQQQQQQQQAKKAAADEEGDENADA